MDGLTLTVLGCGTTAIDYNKGCPGFLLKAGRKNILLETGSGTLYRLARTGMSIDKINTVCYSHHHPDHTSDLLALLHSLKWDPCLKKRHLKIIGPPKVLDLYRQLILYYGDSISPDNRRFKVNLEPASDNQINEGGILIECKRVSHTTDSVGYRFNYKGKTFAYSGDAGLDENLISIAKKSDLLLCECSFPDNRKFRGHLSPGDVESLIVSSGPKKVLLTHIYPGWSKEEKEGLQRLTSRGVSIAEDFVTLAI